LQPRAHSLLRSRTNWRSLLKRHPVASTLLLGLLPNAVMCVLNIVYNWVEIVAKLSSADQRVFFYFQIVIINAIAYTVGLGYVLVSRGEAFRALNRLARGQKVEPPPRQSWSADA